MSAAVVDGAKMQCMFGTSPGTLTILPTDMVKAESKPLGTIMDYVPMMNIGNFGMCQSMMNPMVIAATAAAMGVLTPQSCIPVVVSPWLPGALIVMSANKIVLNKDCMNSCMWAPMGISITDAGTTKTTCG
jgi:hypothetical protein